MIDARILASGAKRLVGRLGPFGAPGFEQRGVVPCSLLGAEPAAGDHPEREQDMRMMIALIATPVRLVDRDIGDHAARDERRADEAEYQRAPLIRAKLMREGKLQFAGELGVLAPFGGLDRGPEAGAVEHPAGRVGRRQYLGVRDAAAAGVVVQLASARIGHGDAGAIGGGSDHALSVRPLHELRREPVDRHGRTRSPSPGKCDPVQGLGDHGALPMGVGPAGGTLVRVEGQERPLSAVQGDEKPCRGAGAASWLAMKRRDASRGGRGAKALTREVSEGQGHSECASNPHRVGQGRGAGTPFVGVQGNDFPCRCAEAAPLPRTLPRATYKRALRDFLSRLRVLSIRIRNVNHRYISDMPAVEQSQVKTALTARPPALPMSACTRMSGRREHLLRRKTQIEAQLASIDARARQARRKRETRANIVIGAVLRSHATLNPGFAEQLAMILDSFVGRPTDRVLLAEVLAMPQLAQAPSPLPCAAAVTRFPARPRFRGARIELTSRH